MYKATFLGTVGRVFSISSIISTGNVLAFHVGAWLPNTPLAIVLVIPIALLVLAAIAVQFDV